MGDNTNHIGDNTGDNKSVISVENVWKRFELSGGKNNDLRERFGSLLGKNNSKRLAAPAPKDKDIFWALREVSFSVQPGQPVGIVGHNGSGKSTMLKLLTGIMEPTEGSIRVKGRIGALIEVGAGFHPDLTGRENVYLSGSILGLTRRDVDSRFDRIVQFANLERFIDTPVKRYSSGMYLRLGFAVAAHTDPDVLLIDEVLAVGDALFQRKCLAHLKEFVKQGGAVVFVSHAMAQVAELCKTCVWLDHGQMRYVGETEKAIEQYMGVVEERENLEWQRNHPGEWELMQADKAREAEETARFEAEAEAQRKRDEAIYEAHMADFSRPRLLELRITDKNNQPRTDFFVGEALTIHIKYQFIEKPPHPVFGIEFCRADGTALFGTSNFDHKIIYENLPLVGEIVMHVPFVTLNEGDYQVRYRQYPDSSLPDWAEKWNDAVENAARFRVDGGAFAHGSVFMPVEWQDAPVKTMEE